MIKVLAFILGRESGKFQVHQNKQTLSLVSHVYNTTYVQVWGIVLSDAWAYQSLLSDWHLLHAFFFKGYMILHILFFFFSIKKIFKLH